MKTIHAKIPEELYRQMDMLVKQGWFRSQENILNEALRRFLKLIAPN
jgi:Arc/MetJ-type ribon-helix-helix transcriptional regulator